MALRMDNVALGKHWDFHSYQLRLRKILLVILGPMYLSMQQDNFGI